MSNLYAQASYETLKTYSRHNQFKAFIQLAAANTFIRPIIESHVSSLHKTLLTKNHLASMASTGSVIATRAVIDIYHNDKKLTPNDGA